MRVVKVQYSISASLEKVKCVSTVFYTLLFDKLPSRIIGNSLREKLNFTPSPVTRMFGQFSWNSFSSIIRGITSVISLVVTKCRYTQMYENYVFSFVLCCGSACL